MLLLLSGCKKSDEQIDTPAKIVSLEGVSDSMLVVVNQIVQARVNSQQSGVATVKWTLDDQVVGESEQLSLKLTDHGTHTLRVEVRTSAGVDSKQVLLFGINGRTTESSKWISRIVDYSPAPGQFINKSPGNQQSAEGIIGKRGMVSLGGYGGYIVFGFDHSLVNSDGVDFAIHGNAFAGSSEPGAVMVAYDANGNGVADDDEWFELAGSEYAKSSTMKNLTLTYQKPSQTETAENILWSASDGTNGQITAIPFHRQCYYPLFLKQGVPATLAYTGNRLAPNGVLNDNGIWELSTLEWGYVDNYSADYMQAIGGDADTERSNKFDIGNAVDSKGGKIQLPAIDFIKVYTAVNQECGVIGEVSTEVCGAISFSK